MFCDDFVFKLIFLDDENHFGLEFWKVSSTSKSYTKNTDLKTIAIIYIN